MMNEFNTPNIIRETTQGFSAYRIVDDMLPHASVMIHDPLIPGGVGGSALKFQAISEDLMRTRTLIAEILAKHTGHTVEEIYEKTANDTYFYGEDAVEYGLASIIYNI